MSAEPSCRLPALQRIIIRIATTASVITYALVGFAYHLIFAGQEVLADPSAPSMPKVEAMPTSPSNQTIISVDIVFILILLALLTVFIVLLLRLKQLANRSEERQKHLRQLLEILDTIDAAVYVVDVKQDQVLYANQYTRNLYGNVIDQPCHEAFALLSATACDPCRPVAAMTDRDPVEAKQPMVYRHPESSRWYQIQSQMIQWIDGREVRLDISTDITKRKEAEVRLDRTYQQTTMFCRVIRDMGPLRTLEEMGAYLMPELVTILNNPHLVLFIFAADGKTLFRLRDGEIKRYDTPELVQTTEDCLSGLDRLTIGVAKPIRPLLLPASWQAPGKQTIIPFKSPPYFRGALVVRCSHEEPCDLHRLKLVQVVLEQAAGNIIRIVNHERKTQQVLDRLNQNATFAGIIGKDPKMQAVYKLIADTAPTTASVLIQGESGTGKELVAKAIHRLSPRSEKPFVVINCAAYPPTLLESELFGHEKGAFSGASRQKPGRFEQADGGTILLDEIGEIAPAAQIKLLRVLQTQKFERVGGERTLSLDIRILAATNRNLIDEVKNGHFREDLYYRLNVIPIMLPPLRERPGDIGLLVHHFTEQFCDDAPPEMSLQAMRYLIAHQWAGNVRELENSVEHALVMSKGRKVEVSHLPAEILKRQPAENYTITGSMIETEKKLLENTLLRCHWNKSKAARQLGISRSTLYYKIKRYHLEQSPSSQSAV